MSEIIKATPIWLQKGRFDNKYCLNVLAIIIKIVGHLTGNFGVSFKYVRVASKFYKQLKISLGKVTVLLTNQSSIGGKFVAC